MCYTFVRDPFPPSLHGRAQWSQAAARGSLEKKGRGRAMGWLCWISPRLSHLLGPYHSRRMRARRRAHMFRVSASSEMSMGSSGKGSEAGV